jgi:hypothetical protein
MALFSRRDIAHAAARPRLHVGDLVPLEVPWTAEMPSPHRSGVLSEHFTIEQCTILCETIEQSRQANEPLNCRLVDIFGDTWIADVDPGCEDASGNVQWRRLAKPSMPRPR